MHIAQSLRISFVSNYNPVSHLNLRSKCKRFGFQKFSCLEGNEEIAITRKLVLQANKFPVSETNKAALSRRSFFSFLAVLASILYPKDSADAEQSGML